MRVSFLCVGAGDMHIDDVSKGRVEGEGGYETEYLLLVSRKAPQ